MTEEIAQTELRWVDSHCHPQMATGGADAAITRARDAGVAAMVVVGTDLESSRQAVDLASRHPDVFATVGLHPHDASRLSAEWEDLVALAKSPRVVAVGEAGFDFHYMHSPPDAQDAAFRAQIRLANHLERALVIHSREAWDATFTVLVQEGVPERTVFHCFTGGPDEARRCLDAGAWLSFSGIVTFKAAEDVRGAAALCPLDRLLVETDSPYLTPVPHRGKPNCPAFVPLVGAAVAAVKGIAVDEVERATWQSTERVFGLAGLQFPDHPA